MLDGPRAKWRAGDTKGLAEEIGMWQQALWKFNSVGHIGKADGPKSWMEAVTPVVSRQDFRSVWAARLRTEGVQPRNP